MGWFDDIKKVAKNFGEQAQCAVGSHKGEWHYINDNKCDEEFVCQRPKCNHIGHRKIHKKWTDWKFIDPEIGKSCDQERSCIRCGEKETRNEHEEWSSWQFTEKDACSQRKICKKCGESETRINHNYNGKPIYTFPTLCVVHEECPRCKSKKNLNYMLHDWEIMEQVNEKNQHLKICKRCSKKEFV